MKIKIDLIVVTFILAFLKLCGVNISWFWVFFPLMAFFAFVAIVIGAALLSAVVFKDKLKITVTKRK